MERGFEFTSVRENGEYVIDESGNRVQAYPKAKLPEYQTKHAAGADFFAAEDAEIPSIWGSVFNVLTQDLRLISYPVDSSEESDVSLVKRVSKSFSPTLIHTGVKAKMEPDEVLEIYNRSSNPKKLGLILANSVGIIDADYYSSAETDGEIMFAMFNFKPWAVHIKVGDKIGQGVFKKFLRPTFNLSVKGDERVGGFGSTN